MKLRQGFVSNSSSSSFIVLLPKNFDVNNFVGNLSDEQIEDYDIDDYLDEDDEDISTEGRREFVKNSLNRLIDEGGLYEYDDSGEMYLCSELLREYVITSMDSGSDDGKVVLLGEEEVDKIYKILGI